MTHQTKYPDQYDLWDYWDERPSLFSFDEVREMEDQERHETYMQRKDREALLKIHVEPKINSDGGPSSYYDFKEDWVTWNDLADYKAANQWGKYSFHLGNIGKALMRWGDKKGASTGYDARKITYSSLRVLLMMEGSTAVKEYLKRLLEDPQFNKGN